MPRYRWHTYICKTLACRAHGTPPHHVWKTVHPTATITPPAGAGRTPVRSPQDQGRLPRPTPCPTVYFLQYSTTAPRDSGEDDDFHVPLPMYTAPLVTIKGGGGLPLKGDVLDISDHDHPHSRSSSHSQHHSEHTRSLLAPTSLFATLNLSSSRDLGASLPLSPRLYPLLQALRVQDNTVPSHTLLLDVRSRSRNQDKPVRYCVASCINIWDEETCSIY